LWLVMPVLMGSELHNQFKEAEAIIRESDYILLAGHTNPDGDSLGSMLGFDAALRDNVQSKSILYAPDGVPSSLAFLVGERTLSDSVEWYPDLIIGFDYSDYDRLELPQEMIQGARMITFDHHPPLGQRGDVKVIDTSFSSASEIVYEFLKAREWQISRDTAQCLLTGILTDTGALAHTNTSARTLKNVGELLQKGAPMRAIYAETFAGKSAKILNVWGDLLQKIKKHPKHNFVSVFVPFQEFKKYGIVLDDLTGIIAVLNLVADADFSVFIVEYERGKIKGSLRSEEFKGVDYAAGFKIEGLPKEAQDKILKAIKQHFEEERITT